MLLKVRLKEKSETKNKSKFTHELVERKVKKKKNIHEIQQEKKRFTYTNEERREYSR